MFGNDQQQTTVGAQPQSPSMLDNVTSQDFNGFNQPQASAPTPSPAVIQPQQFTAPTKSSTTATPTTAPTVDTAYEASDMSGFTSPTTTQEPSPSGPVNPPQPIATTTVIDESGDDADTQVVEDTENHDTYMEAITKDSDDSTKGSPDASDSSHVDIDKLSKMKKQALEKLEPLVKHLDQKPEDEFKTTMMLIQASDNHTLIDKALAAAEKIKDDQERAQAMLDIVNEINYFSQNDSTS